MSIPRNAKFVFAIPPASAKQLSRRCNARLRAVAWMAAKI